MRRHDLSSAQDKAVSYTHLDVYKRQVLRYGLKYTEQSGGVTKNSRQRSEISIGLMGTRKYYAVESWERGTLGDIITT